MQGPRAKEMSLSRQKHFSNNLLARKTVYIQIRIIESALIWRRNVDRHFLEIQICWKFCYPHHSTHSPFRRVEMVLTYLVVLEMKVYTTAYVWITNKLWGITMFAGKGKVKIVTPIKTFIRGPTIFYAKKKDFAKIAIFRRQFLPGYSY